MKKFYTFIALMVAMFASSTANAAVESATELFGKWKFTASIEYLDNSYKDKILAESEVIIKKDPLGTFAAEIEGICGVEDSYQQVSRVTSTDAGMALKITNPNGGGFDAWGSLGLWMADVEGNNPFNGFGNLYYAINDAGTEISIPDFTFVKLAAFTDDKGEIIAKVSNAKLTLVETEKIEVNDISGKYELNITSSYNYGKVESWPTQIDMEVVSKDDTNQNYTVTWTTDIYKLTFDATFNGNNLSLPYSKMLVANDSIYMAPSSGATLDGSVVFNLAGENLVISSGCTFVVPFDKNEDGVVDSLSYVFWYGDGIAKKPRVLPSVNYEGTYNAVATVAYNTETQPVNTTGKIVIEYNDKLQAYQVKEFLGYTNPFTFNYDVMYFVPDAEDPLKGVITCACLEHIGNTPDGKDYRYIAVRDVNMQENDIPVTFDADGNMTIKEMCVVTTTWMGTEAEALAVFFSPVVATKAPAPSPMDWLAATSVTPVTYAYTAEDETIPTTGAFKVSYYENTDEYLVEDFMGYDLYTMNYGGLLLTPDAKDPHKAIMECGTIDFISESMEDVVIYDKNLGMSGIEFTLNDDGTVTVGDFVIAKGPWGAAPTTILAATSAQSITGISNITTATSKNMMFNLAGQKVNTLQRGITIKNVGGKFVKVIK